MRGARSDDFVYQGTIGTRVEQQVRGGGDLSGEFTVAVAEAAT